MKNLKLVLIFICLLLTSAAFSQDISMRKMHKLAKKGDVETQFELGRIYETGTGVEQDSLKAFEYYEMAAENENLEAIKWMISYYERNKEGNENMLYLWIMQAVEAGLDYDYRISKIYKNGDGVEADSIMSFYYCKKAAINGNVSAQMDLAEMYLNGYGTKKSEELWINWLDSAALNGSVKTQLQLANIFFTRKKVLNAEKLAIGYYSEAAETGDVIAQICLINLFSGKCRSAADSIQYEKWKTIFSNNPAVVEFSTYKLSMDKEELEYYFTQLAADSLHTVAIFGLWRNYRDLLVKSGNQNDVLFQLLNLAEQNDGFAQYLVAEHCYLTRDTCLDKKKLFAYAYRSANLGIPEAMFLLGELYYEGDYVGQNYSSAILYYSRAASENVFKAKVKLPLANYGYRDYIGFISSFNQLGELNDPLSFYYMSQLYLNGIRIEADSVKAAECCKIAAENGVNDAMFQLGVFYYEGIGVEKDCSLAFSWFEKLDDKAYPESQYYMALMLFDGCGVNKNTTDARALMKLSADNGCNEAQYYYAEMIYKGEIEGVEKQASIEYYTLAAPYHRQAAGRLGYIYYNGEFGLKNDELAKSYLSEYAHLDETGKTSYIVALLICETDTDDDLQLRSASWHCELAIECGYTPAKKLWKECKLSEVNVIFYGY